MSKAPFLRFNLKELLDDKKILSEKIIQVLKKQLKEHNELSGCRVPPVRVLAHQLGVSKNTVQSAYDELKSQGLIESRSRQGLFVSTPSPNMKESTDFQIKTVPAPSLHCTNLAPPYSPKNNQMINLSHVFLDPQMAPLTKFNECFRSILKSNKAQSKYEMQGFFPLREIIAKRLQQRGINTSPEFIILTNGSQSALDLVSRSLERKVVATENPAYHLGKALLEFNKVNTIGLPINPFTGINLEEWEKKIKKFKPELLYLTTNFQNPTGYSYTSVELNHIIEWSHQYGFGILEDDWGSDMLSFSEFSPSIRAQGGDNVLYMNSFTKKVIPSLRLGYLVANEQTAKALANAKRISSIALPTLIEKALFEFIDRGYYDVHLKSIQLELDQRYKNCLELLKEVMPEEVNWTGPGGGPLLWLEIPRKVPMALVIAELKKHNIIASASEDAFFGTPHLHGLRIGYAFLSQKEMRFALEILAKTIKKFLKEKGQH